MDSKHAHLHDKENKNTGVFQLMKQTLWEMKSQTFWSQKGSCLIAIEHKLKIIFLLLLDLFHHFSSNSLFIMMPRLYWGKLFNPLFTKLQVPLMPKFIPILTISPYSPLISEHISKLSHFHPVCPTRLSLSSITSTGKTFLLYDHFTLIVAEVHCKTVRLQKW